MVSKVSDYLENPIQSCLYPNYFLFEIGTNPQQGTENREPLPNPWGSRSNESGTNTNAGSGQEGTGSGNNSNRFSNMFRGMPPRGVLNTPAMRSLMQQMAENPQLMSSLINAPYTRSMMDAMYQDPEFATRVLSSSPLMVNNPQLQEQMRQIMPQFLAQMRNPETANLATNPEALNAIMLIQQGIEQLRNAAPGVMNSMGIPAPPPGVTTAGTGNTTATTTTTATAASTTTPSSTPILGVNTSSTDSNNSTTAGSGVSANDEQLFNDFMTQMLNVMSLSGDSSQPPEVRYQAQLDQLAAMGFANRDANLQGIFMLHINTECI